MSLSMPRQRLTWGMTFNAMVVLKRNYKMNKQLKYILHKIQFITKINTGCYNKNQQCYIILEMTSRMLKICLNS